MPFTREQLKRSASANEDSAKAHLEQSILQLSSAKISATSALLRSRTERIAIILSRAAPGGSYIEDEIGLYKILCNERLKLESMLHALMNE